MMSLWDALRMNMMISYQELVRTFPGGRFTESFYSGTFQKNLTVDRRTDLNQYGHILCQ